MNADQVYNKLLVPNDSKLALVVLDGLGDIATQSTGFRTPLEAAHTPNLDMLAKRSSLGRMIPVAPGITPGSGPGHLSLFGYDPLEYEVGRGVIEAIGLGIDLKHGDVAARANFCSLDARGIVTDRRAGRIDTKICEAQCALLAGKIKKIGDVEIIIRAGKGHRFVVVFRGKGLEGPLNDSDPHREGLPIATVKPLAKSAKATKSAKVIAAFYKQALLLLKDCNPANGFLLRGIAHQPRIPLFAERYGLKAAAIAISCHGDPLRHILWKTFARTRRLLVRMPERAIAPQPITVAFLVAGEHDEPTASAARLYLERGLVGKFFLLG